MTKKIVLNLNEGNIIEFINKSVQLSKDLLEQNCNDFDLFIEEISNRDFDLTEKMTNELFLEKLENLLNISLSNLDKKNLIGDIITFEIEKYDFNAPNYKSNIKLSLKNKDLNQNSSLVLAQINACLVKEKVILNNFKEDLNKLNLSKYQLAYLTNKYVEADFLFKNLMSIDENLIADIYELIISEINILMSINDSFVLDKNTIVNILNNMDNLKISLFKDKINILDLDDKIEIYLFDYNNKFFLNKKDYISIAI